MGSRVPAKGAHDARTGRPYGDVGGRWEAGVPTAGDNSARFARGPRATFSHSAIPDRSPAMLSQQSSGAGTPSCGLVQRIGTADSRPTPTPAGDKPPRYIFSFIGQVYNSARFARGEPASRLIEGHMFVRMTK